MGDLRTVLCLPIIFFPAQPTTIGKIHYACRDVPTNEAIAHAGQEYPWVTAYEEGRSFQELEVVHMLPEMQVQKGATIAERKQAVCCCWSGEHLCVFHLFAYPPERKPIMLVIISANPHFRLFLGMCCVA